MYDFSSTVGTQPENFVKDGGVESMSSISSSGTTWTASGGGTKAIATSPVHTGGKSIKITRASGNVETVISQTITGLIPGRYVLSAYVNTSSITSLNNGCVYIGTGRELNYKTGGWEQISHTVNVTGTSLTFNITVEGFVGNVYIDDIQFERCITGTDGAPSSVNLVNNGSIARSDSWNLTNAAYSNGAIKMNAGPNTTSYATQAVSLNMPGTQTYIYSAWAQAESGPLDRT